MPERLIGRYERAPAACLPYDPSAPMVARWVGGMVRERVPGVAVEHIGSTAVPGCAGKGVIDLLIPYENEDLEPVKSALRELGFQRQSTKAPFPENRPMRVGSIDHEGHTFRLHVHVVPAASDEPAVLRSFRDRLRSDPDLLRAYVGEKRRIIEGGTTDSVDYSIVKGAFVERALEET